MFSKHPCFRSGLRRVQAQNPCLFASGGLAAVIVSLCLTPVASAQTPGYTITDLGIAAGDAASYAKGINNLGQVVGYDTAGPLAGASPPNHAETWTVAGSAVTVTSLYPGTYTSNAYAINDSGLIVGESLKAGDIYTHPTLWSINSGVVTNTSLATSNNAYGAADAINASGQIAGVAQTSFTGMVPGPQYAATWTVQSGTVTALALDQTTVHSSSATGINNAGIIVGSSSETGTYNGTIFMVSGSTVTRTSLGGNTLSAVNTAGTILGSGYSSGASQSHAEFFTVSGSTVTATDLGTLGGTNPYSIGYSLNNSGQAVGLSSTASGTTGFVYTAGNGMRDVNSLIGTTPLATNIGFTAASGNSVQGNLINDWGQIAAVGTVGGATHALLLNPTTPNSSVAGPGQNTRLVGGMSYSLTPAFSSPGPGTGTVATFLDGVTGSAGTGTYGANRSLTQTFATTDGQHGILTNTMAVTGTSSDTFTVQMNFDATHPATIVNGQPNTWLGSYNMTTGRFDKAAADDVGATLVFVPGAYDPNMDDHLGYYGLDPVNHTAWAVVDYDGTFAVIPEPGTPACVLLLSAAAFGWIIRRRTSRA